MKSAALALTEFKIVQPDVERGGAVRQPARRNQVDAGTGERVSRSDLVKGYQFAKGNTSC